MSPGAIITGGSSMTLTTEVSSATAPQDFTAEFQAEASLTEGAVSMAAGGSMAEVMAGAGAIDSWLSDGCTVRSRERPKASREVGHISRLACNRLVVVAFCLFNPVNPPINPCYLFARA
jgi:hypothetical protein